jgi:hypothetical protein
MEAMKIGMLCLIVDVDGFSYFVVDKDRSKGDRRSDGKFTSDFFKIVDTPDATQH